MFDKVKKKSLEFYMLFETMILKYTQVLWSEDTVYK